MDMENLMAQAQQLQAKVDAAQQELANTVSVDWRATAK